MTLSLERGSRECRVRAAPAVSRAKGNKEKRTRAYRFSGSNPAFPAQWFYGLYRALLGERIRLVTVAAGLIADRIRSDRFRHRQLGTSNGCRNHTVLPYATTPFVCAPVVRSRVWLNPKPALQFTCSPDAAASTASNPASETIARPSVGSDGGIPKAVSSKPARGIFSGKGLDKRDRRGLR